MKSNNFLKVIPVLMLMAYGITFNSCTYDKADNQPCNGLLPDTISFKSDILPLLHNNCSTTDCHSGSNPKGNLNLEDSLAYTSLMKPGSGYVKVDNPTHSLFYSQLISNSQPMPPTGKLDDCKIEMVLRWIEQGAINN